MNTPTLGLLLALLPLIPLQAQNVVPVPDAMTNDALLHRRDINGDGCADMFIYRNPGTVAFLCGTPSNPATFQGSPSILDHTYDYSTQGPVDCVDFNGDGQADMLVSINTYISGSTSRLHIWLLTGTLYMSTVEISTTYNPFVWTPIAAADFNGDGHADVLFRSADGSGRLCIWYFNGTTRTGSAIISTTYNTAIWIPFTAADFDGDGHADIAFRTAVAGDLAGDATTITPPALSDSSQARIAVWFMNGSTKTSAAVLPTTYNANTWNPVAAADYDGDGKADIALRRYSDGQFCYWYMNGVTRKTSALTGGIYAGTQWNPF